MYQCMGHILSRRGLLLGCTMDGIHLRFTTAKERGGTVLLRLVEMEA